MAVVRAFINQYFVHALGKPLDDHPGFENRESQSLAHSRRAELVEQE
jgi:hypothetical protein